MPKPPVSEQVQVNFRMPPELRDALRVLAERNNRSLNAEIVAALVDWVERPTPQEIEARAAAQMLEALKAERAYTERRIAELSDRISSLVPFIEGVKPKS